MDAAMRLKTMIIMGVFPNTEPVRPLSMFQAGLDGGFRASKYEWKQSTNTNL
ncbi:hypothetical protein C370_07414 [Cryptococcus neoformans A1-35-8]|nr:hypothetical protein C370_07414 [Cryptococcus neoformans var. grubii A1-35-8]